jgi:hypothetical protein
MFMEIFVEKGYNQSSKEGHSSLAYQDLGEPVVWYEIHAACS